MGKEAITVPAGNELASRLQSVLKCIYLIFTESYFSLSDENVMRKDLCGEAIYLCEHLTLYQATARPEVYALLSLMCFHTSRFDARMDAQGDMLTFEEQNRKHWDRRLIEKGAAYLDRSIGGDHLSSYHIEAMIAAQYSLAATADAIDWQTVLGLYDQLLLFNASSSVHINRAYVLSKVQGAGAAIQFLLSMKDRQTDFFYQLMLGELCKKDHQIELSKQYFMRAAGLIQPGKVKTAIDNKLKELSAIN